MKQVDKGQVVATQKIWLSRREVRHYLDVSDEWIAKYLYGECHVYHAGNKMFFKQTEIDRYIERNRIT